MNKIIVTLATILAAVSAPFKKDGATAVADALGSFTKLTDSLKKGIEKLEKEEEANLAAVYEAEQKLVALRTQKDEELTHIYNARRAATIAIKNVEKLLGTGA